jgi:hypothetical protein
MDHYNIIIPPAESSIYPYSCMQIYKLNLLNMHWKLRLHTGHTDQKKKKKKKATNLNLHVHSQ